MSLTINNSDFETSTEGTFPLGWTLIGSDDGTTGRIAGSSSYGLLCTSLGGSTFRILNQNNISLTTGIGTYDLTYTLKLFIISGPVGSDLTVNTRILTDGSSTYDTDSTTYLESNFTGSNGDILYAPDTSVVADYEYEYGSGKTQEVTHTVDITVDTVTTIEFNIAGGMSSNYIVLIDSVDLAEQIGGGGDPHIKTIMGSVYDLPVNNLNYIFVQSLDNELIVNIKTQQIGKVSYIRYVYFYYKDFDFVVDLNTLKIYLVSDFTFTNLNILINTFTLDQEISKTVSTINADYIKAYMEKGKLRIKLGRKYNFTLNSKSRHVMVSNRFNQETYTGILIDKTNKCEISSLISLS
jgi:hypothetical protein